MNDRCNAFLAETARRLASADTVDAGDAVRAWWDSEMAYFTAAEQDWLHAEAVRRTEEHIRLGREAIAGYTDDQVEAEGADPNELRELAQDTATSLEAEAYLRAGQELPPELLARFREATQRREDKRQAERLTGESEAEE